MSLQTTSISQTNLWPMMSFARPSTGTNEGPSADGSFAASLDKVQADESTQPLYLSSMPQAKTVAVPTQPEEEEESDSSETLEIKISRPPKLESAEKTTEVAQNDDDFGIGDLVDLLNPLQHIPIIGTIYRELTGDSIKPEIQVAGSVIFGALTGSLVLSAASGVAGAMFEETTGEEPTVQVAQALFGYEHNETEDIAPEATTTDKNVLLASAPSVDKQKVEDKTTQALKTQLANLQAADINDQAVNLSSAVSKNAVVASTTRATNGTRVGNVIYTSPLMRSAAKVPVPTANTTAVAAAQNTTTTSVQQTAATYKEMSLGDLLHEQMLAQEQGKKLPSEMVQELMAKALEKYGTAQQTASAQTDTAILP